jgi:hypothetical protein
LGSQLGEGHSLVEFQGFSLGAVEAGVNREGL